MSTSSTRAPASLGLRCAGLFVALLALYGATASGTVGSRVSDGRSMYAVTAALVERGALDVPAALGVPGRAGRSYSKYGLGQSLVAVPLYVVGRAVAGRLHPPERPQTLLLAGSLLSPIVVALLCALLPLLAAGLGTTTPAGALWAGLVAGIATPLWPYTQTFFGEPLIALCLVVAVLCLGAAREVRQARRAVLLLGCGAAMGLALLTRLDSLIYLPVIVLAAAVPAPSVKRAATCVLLILLPVGLALLGTAWYNAARFGSVLESGYGRGAQGEAVDVVFRRTPALVSEGLWDLLASPGKGLIFYAPLVILVPWGAWQVWHARRRWTLFTVLGLCGVDWLAHANVLIRWLGGWAWGPRFLVPVVPLLVVLACAARGRRLVVVALALAGALVQAPAVIGDIHPYLDRLGTQYGSPYRAESAYVPSLVLSPIVGQWRFVLDPASWQSQRDWGHRSALAVAGVDARPPHYGAPLPHTWWAMLASEGTPWRSWAPPLAVLVLLGGAGGMVAWQPGRTAADRGTPGSRAV